MYDDQTEKQFILIGNHPCLDFINTLIVQNGERVDLLESFSDLIMWLEQMHVLDKEEAKKAERHWGNKPEGVRILSEAREFRASLREMVERIATGKSVPPAAIETINKMLRYRVVYRQVTRRAGTFEQQFQADSQEAELLLGLLAESASDLLCTCDLSLIKQCQNPACILFFYDTTKNHGRHWCSMSACGNRLKVAAHYRRHRPADKRHR